MANAGSEETLRNLHLQKAREGDNSSLWRLCIELRPRLLRVVADLLGPQIRTKLDPSDVVQDALTAAVGAFHGFRGESIEEWEAWMIEITKNEAKNSIRFWRQSRRDVAAEKLSIDAVEGAIIQAIDDSTPSGRVIKVEQASELLSAIQQLPRDERQVIQMRHLQGKRLSEIADSIGRSHDGTAGLLKRAMARLRSLLVDHSEESESGNGR